VGGTRIEKGRGPLNQVINFFFLNPSRTLFSYHATGLGRFKHLSPQKANQTDNSMFILMGNTGPIITIIIICNARGQSIFEFDDLATARCFVAVSKARSCEIKKKKTPFTHLSESGHCREPQMRGTDSTLKT